MPSGTRTPSMSSAAWPTAATIVIVSSSSTLGASTPAMSASVSAETASTPRAAPRRGRRPTAARSPSRWPPAPSVRRGLGALGQAGVLDRHARRPRRAPARPRRRPVGERAAGALLGQVEVAEDRLAHPHRHPEERLHRRMAGREAAEAGCSRRSSSRSVVGSATSRPRIPSPAGGRPMRSRSSRSHPHDDEPVQPPAVGRQHAQCAVAGVRRAAPRPARCRAGSPRAGCPRRPRAARRSARGATCTSVDGTAAGGRAGSRPDGRSAGGRGNGPGSGRRRVPSRAAGEAAGAAAGRRPGGAGLAAGADDDQVGPAGGRRAAPRRRAARGPRSGRGRARRSRRSPAAPGPRAGRARRSLRAERTRAEPSSGSPSGASRTVTATTVASRRAASRSAQTSAPCARRRAVDLDDEPGVPAGEQRGQVQRFDGGAVRGRAGGDVVRGPGGRDTRVGAVGREVAGRSGPGVVVLARRLRRPGTRGAHGVIVG